jgi:hypothetical protein
MIAYVTKEVGRVKDLFRDRERSLIAERDAAGTAQRKAESLASASDDRVAAAVAEAVVRLERQLISLKADFQVPVHLV